jgi:hypothetical protein
MFSHLIGILLALVVMSFVFDQLWPVRTVTSMRSALATVLRSEAKFLRLTESTGAASTSFKSSSPVSELRRRTHFEAHDPKRIGLTGKMPLSLYQPSFESFQ